MEFICQAIIEIWERSILFYSTLVEFSVWVDIEAKFNFRLGGKILIKSNGFDFAHFTPSLFKRKYGIFNDDMIVFGEFHNNANP